MSSCGAESCRSAVAELPQDTANRGATVCIRFKKTKTLILQSMRISLFFWVVLSMWATSCDKTSDDRYDPSYYKNPITSQKLPDPTVIRDGDTFYLYATEAIRNVPIMKSKDLVNWTLCGTVFSEATRPDFTEGGEVWLRTFIMWEIAICFTTRCPRGAGSKIAESALRRPRLQGPWINHGKLSSVGKSAVSIQ